MNHTTAEVLSTMETHKIKEAADSLANEIIEDLEQLKTIYKFDDGSSLEINNY